MRGGEFGAHHGHENPVEQRNESEVCRPEAHFGRGDETFRSGRHNSARRAEHDSPSGAKKGRRGTRVPVCQAKSRSTRPAQGSIIDFERKQEPESQGQAATPGKRAPRNTLCRNGSKHEPRARHQRPVLGLGQASQPTTGCKQWPASFSRVEYHPTDRTKLNHFWLMPVNYWL